MRVSTVSHLHVYLKSLASAPFEIRACFRVRTHHHGIIEDTPVTAGATRRPQWGHSGARWVRVGRACRYWCGRTFIGSRLRPRDATAVNHQSSDVCRAAAAGEERTVSRGPWTMARHDVQRLICHLLHLAKSWGASRLMFSLPRVHRLLHCTSGLQLAVTSGTRAAALLVLPILPGYRHIPQFTEKTCQSSPRASLVPRRVGSSGFATTEAPRTPSLEMNFNNKIRRRRRRRSVTSYKNTSSFSTSPRRDARPATSNEQRSARRRFGCVV
ncbi:hypothetical protein OH76DRAFT_514898 [Lentinus brumalis]|uniref:Uncharacterized protein n=1 Tax=Lentinus brumalis TaxID=2498619 RepID=A0A371DBC5_9APHY|nr:hypothetical protein OH76DRAFT_514898 [Polyporus brumalis]